MQRRILVTLIALVAATAATAAAPRPWMLVRGRNVVVIGQQPAKALQDVALEIEQFKSALGGLMRGAGEPLPIATVVYAFADRKALEPFVPLYQGKPAALGGFCYCGRGTGGSFIAVNLSSDAEWSRIVFHEYTHLLLRQATSSLPVWLNEGLAEYYSTFHLRNDGREAEVGAPVAQHIGLLRRRRIPVAELLAVDQSSALYNESERRSIFYAEAWALTHYLLTERPNGAAAVNQYVADVASGHSTVSAFAEAFGVAPADMDGVLDQYVRRPLLRSAIHPLADRIGDKAPEERAAEISPADAEARLGLVQLRVGRLPEATRRIEAAAAAGPDAAQAQLALGLLRLDQRLEAEALPPLEKAARLAPDDFDAQYTFALTLLKHSADGPAVPDDRRELAHAALARAIAIDPQSADALAWLAYADLLLNARMPEARAAITRAVALAPARAEYRLRLAEVCVRQGDFTEARRVLAALVDNRDREMAQAARGLVASIDKVEQRRRTAAIEAAAEQQEAALAAARDSDRQFRSQPYVTLRSVRHGEERAYGQLTRVDCSPQEVRLYLSVGERAISVTAKRVADIQTASFLDRKDITVTCGTHMPPDEVYLTWRPASGARDGEAPVVGTAVAVEFVPKGAIPQP